MKPKALLLVIDCLRFDYSNAFDFDGFTKLNKVVAASNWTFPAMWAVLTGRHPHDAQAGLVPIDDKGNVQWGEEAKFRDYHYKTLLEEYNNARAFTEIPMILYAFQQKDLAAQDKIEMTPYDYRKTLPLAQQAINDGVRFVYIHLKGPHEPYTYSMGGAATKNKEFYMYQAKYYEKELSTCVSDIEDFIARNKDQFENIVIMADHGEYLIEDMPDDPEAPFDTTSHGYEFNHETLHIPMWVNRWLAPDELYSATMVHDYLLGLPVYPVDFVVSSSCAYKNAADYAISYINQQDRLVIEQKQLRKWE